MNNTIGIDASKDTLDVHRLADGQHKQFLNSKTGQAHLMKWIEVQPDPLVIFEATGAYHRLLERKLGNRSIRFVKVNPKQARRFAQASGKLAKTDRVDCEMLAKMGAALQLVPKPLTAESLYDLRDLLCARRALIKDRTAAKARIATVTHALLKGQLAKRLRHIECDIAKIDTAMLALANQDRQMRERLDILASISWHRCDYGTHDPGGHARDRRAGRQTSCEPCWPRTDVTKLRQMAGKGTDTRRSPKSTTRHLHACAGRDPPQRGYESQIQSTHRCRERKESRHYSSHAQTACPCKCLTARSTKMDGKHGLTKTDTPT